MNKHMVEGNEDLIDLFHAVEGALAIVGEKALSELHMSLDTVEIETNLAVTKSVGGGFKVDATSLDASVKKSGASAHGYKLRLRRHSNQKATLGIDENEIAEAIFCIAAATRAINSRTLEFYVDEATVTVDLTKTREGEFKVFVGGEGKSETICSIVLTFTLRNL